MRGDEKYAAFHFEKCPVPLLLLLLLLLFLPRPTIHSPSLSPSLFFSVAAMIYG